ncbi:hypothetical protein BMS88_06005 [Leuconostoc pseudomesenteroides]|nr:hypothetical protein BMS88_06005 [Leuconostoc pseudomesenteroides]
MQNEVQVFDNLKVKEENGQILFDAESAAIKIGISLNKKGVDYVRWERVRKYLNSPQVEKGDFITEPQLYKLAIKANSAQAEKFQEWVTSEVLPTIRQTGGYQLAPKDPMQVLELMFQSLKMQDYRQERLERKINSIQNSQTISGDQELVLRQIRNEKAVQILGYKGNARYQALSRMVFARISKEFKSKFSIPRYNALLAKDFEKAKRYLMKWEPDDAFAYRIAYRKGVKK